MAMALITYSPQAERTFKENMLVSVGIETVRKMYAAVSAIIRIVERGDAKVEIVAIRITIPDTHTPRAIHHIDGAIEVVAIHKLTILAIAKHIHQVLVAHIEQIVVIVDGIVVSEHHIVEHLIGLVEKIKVDFKHIVILSVRESELMSHTVGKEARLVANLVHTHRSKTLHTDSCQDYHH